MASGRVLYTRHTYSTFDRMGAVMTDGTTDQSPKPRKQSDPIRGPWLGPSLQDEQERGLETDQGAEQSADHRSDSPEPEWADGLGETGVERQMER